MTDDITVRRAEPEDIEELARLFAAEGRFSERWWRRSLWHLLFHDYQREHAIAHVAVSGRRVLGLQCLVRWPVMADATVLDSMQSCRSLVAPMARGRGVFSTLLSSVSEEARVRGVDLLFGFPNPASFKSFLRAGWTFAGSGEVHSVALSVKGRVGVLLLAARARRRRQTFPEFEAQRLGSGETIGPSDAPAFNAWRGGLRAGGPYVSLVEGSTGAATPAKIEVHARLRELLVGTVLNRGIPDAVLDSARDLNVDVVSGVVPSPVMQPGPGLGYRTGRTRPIVALPLTVDCPGSWQLGPDEVDTW